MPRLLGFCRGTPGDYHFQSKHFAFENSAKIDVLDGIILVYVNN